MQPQDRRSSKPGDSDLAVLARHRWLKRGHGQGLIESLRPWIVPKPLRTLDLGCGEGSFAPALFPSSGEQYCGIDLSKRAMRLAARRWPAGTWVLANADRILPAADGSVHRVVSLFGRRPAAEIRRVLVSGGSCLMVVPGEDDFIELREHVQQSGHRRSRWQTVVEEMIASGLDFVEHKTWQTRVELEPDAIADALAMTYRGGRHSEQAKLRSLSTMKVTLSADMVRLRL